MASVTVTLHGTLNTFVAGRLRSVRVDLPEPGQAGEVLERLGLPLGMLSLLLINGQRVEVEAPLADGDQIEAFPVCGGWGVVPGAGKMPALPDGPG